MKNVKKLLFVLLSILSITLSISCNNAVASKPDSYVDGTWEGLFKGFHSAMSNNYAFWSLDSPSDEWDKVYDEHIDAFKSFGKVDYDDTVTTKKATLALMDCCKDLSDGHFRITISTGTGMSAFFPRAFQLVSPAYQSRGGSQSDLLSDYYDWYVNHASEAEARIKENQPDDYTTEKAENIIKQSFGVQEVGGELVSTCDSTTYSSLTTEQQQYYQDWTTGASSRGNLDDYFSTWILDVHVDEDAGDTYYYLLGLTNGSNSEIPENCIYFAFSTFNLSSLKDSVDVGVLYDKFVELKRDSTVKGIIYDVRGNGGGANKDSDLLYGDLVGSDLQFGWYRTKDGDNRLDYTAWLPLYLYASGDSVSTLVDKPKALITNRGSGSNSEVSSMLFNVLPKAATVGGTTYGAQGCLTGSAGYPNSVCFSVGSYLPSVYTPNQQTVALDKTCYEGKRVPPTIPVDLNYQEFISKTLQKDARLEAAWNYISDHQ